MSKRWIASGTILFLGFLILAICQFGITNIDSSLLFLLGASKLISGIILISFAFGAAISEQL